MTMTTQCTVVIVVLLILGGGTSEGGGGGGWGYQGGREGVLGPDRWKELPGTSCGGRRQSPIRVYTDQALYPGRRSVGGPVRVVFQGGGSSRSPPPPESSSMVKVSSTSVYVTFSKHWTLTLGPGRPCLRPLGIHWHWGLSSDRGSEHSLDGSFFPLEGHLVTFDCSRYQSASEAQASRDGLVVFGLFYKIGNPNPGLKRLEPSLAETWFREKVPIKEVSPRTFLPSRNLGDYFQYEGSLTTPPCSENVEWIIFREVQTVSEDQLRRFRALRFRGPDSGPMGDNFRPTFSSQDRLVLASFEDDQ